MRRIKSWRLPMTGLAAFAGFLAALPAHADVKDGVDAWSRGDFKAAVREWRGPASKGDADAQFNLAQAHKLGRGVPQNLTQAEKLFEKAAAGGHLQAADNFGLLLFQRGERARAMPFIHAASKRGDPRAQYVLGLAHFNGDSVPKDWERAYALVSLAQQAGLPQASDALKQMDQYIPLEQRQRSVPLAGQIAAQAAATRRNQVAAADLGVTGPGSQRATSDSLRPFRSAATTVKTGPATAGADYTRGGVPQVASILQKRPAVSAPSTPAAVTRPAPPAQSAATVRTGPWRVQLGAYGVRTNADSMWNRVKARPELAGHPKLAIPAGRITKLQAGGFRDRPRAQAACSALKAGGFDCIVTRK